MRAAYGRNANFLLFDIKVQNLVWHENDDLFGFFSIRNTRVLRENDCLGRRLSKDKAEAEPVALQLSPAPERGNKSTIIINRVPGISENHVNLDLVWKNYASLSCSLRRRKKWRISGTEFPALPKNGMPVEFRREKCPTSHRFSPTPKREMNNKQTNNRVIDVSKNASI